MREFIKYSKTVSAHEEGSNFPKRDTIIGHDDFLNLKIALETSQDVLQFVEDCHIFDPHE